MDDEHDDTGEPDEQAARGAAEELGAVLARDQAKVEDQGDSQRTAEGGDQEALGEG